MAIGEHRFAVILPVGDGPLFQAQLAALQRRVDSWARSWLPSIFLHGAIADDFDDWMDWGTDKIAEVLLYRCFAGLSEGPLPADRAHLTR
eukprot:1378259-Pyramimonas_sp.AAC.1